MIPNAVIVFQILDAGGLVVEYFRNIWGVARSDTLLGFVLVQCSSDLFMSKYLLMHWYGYYIATAEVEIFF